MRIAQSNYQMKQNKTNLSKPAFGDYKVEIVEGELNKLMMVLKGSEAEKINAVSDILGFTNKFEIKNQNEGTIKLHSFKIDNNSNPTTPIFHFDAKINRMTIHKGVRGINQPAIVSPYQVLDKIKAGLNFLSLGL